MIRSTVGKVMWVGRATVFLVGLTVILALVLGVASMALGANGNPLILGKAKNTASKVTGLVKRGAGPALSLKVDSGPPMAVNSQAMVANLNADQLDGKDQSAFADVSELDSATVISRWSALPTQGTYTSEGGSLVISAAGSGFRSDSNTRTVGDIGMRILVDGTERGQALLHANEVESHKPFVARQVVIKGLAAGTHTIRLEALYASTCNTASETRFTVCTTTNSNDRFEVSVLEFAD